MRISARTNNKNTELSPFGVAEQMVATILYGAVGDIKIKDDLYKYKHSRAPIRYYLSVISLINTRRIC